MPDETRGDMTLGSLRENVAKQLHCGVGLIHRDVLKKYLRSSECDYCGPAARTVESTLHIATLKPHSVTTPGVPIAKRSTRLRLKKTREDSVRTVYIEGPRTGVLARKQSVAGDIERFAFTTSKMWGTTVRALASDVDAMERHTITGKEYIRRCGGSLLHAIMLYEDDHADLNDLPGSKGWVKNCMCLRCG